MATITTVYEDDSAAIVYAPPVKVACVQNSSGFCAEGWTARTGVDDFSDSNVYAYEPSNALRYQTHRKRHVRDSDVALHGTRHPSLLDVRRSGLRQLTPQPQLGDLHGCHVRDRRIAVDRSDVRLDVEHDHLSHARLQQDLRRRGGTRLGDAGCRPTIF